uniref:Uncharacterized protein n=1 Tax=Ulva partita TaxID=1605170 RepID=A0A1C9ZPS1_9CHLO|nr:hypothetical protein [Ulva partita]
MLAEHSSRVGQYLQQMVSSQRRDVVWSLEFCSPHYLGQVCQLIERRKHFLSSAAWYTVLKLFRVPQELRPCSRQVLPKII